MLMPLQIDWLSPLEIPIIRHAFFGLVLAGGMISLLGVIIITFNLSGIRFTLMHVGLLGAAVTMGLGLNPTTGAFILIMAVSVLMGSLGERINLSINAISGFFMTGSMGLAFIVLSRYQVRAMDIFGIFAGNILFLSKFDLILVALLGVLIVGIFFFFYREIQLVLLDKELATTLGVPVGRIRMLLFLLLGASMAISLRLMGALLVDSLILLPAMAALPLAKGLNSALVLTSIFGILSTSTGFLVALRYDLPVGASVAVVGCFFLMVSLVFQRRKVK